MFIVLTRTGWDKDRIGRYASRFLLGFFMFGLAFSMPMHPAERTIAGVIYQVLLLAGIDSMFGIALAFFISAIGIWFAPTKNPIELFAINMPAFLYVCMAIGGFIVGMLNPVSFVWVLTIYDFMVLVYWICL